MERLELENRTLEFSKNTILACRNLPRGESNKILINQLLRSATSVGANYREANGAPTRKDFKNKIHICKKEAQESNYLITLMMETDKTTQNILADLQDESRQLMLIFGKITATLSKEPDQT